MYMHMIRTLYHMHGGCFSNAVFIGHGEPTMQAIIDGGVLVSCSTNWLNPLPRHLFYLFYHFIFMDYG